MKTALLLASSCVALFGLTLQESIDTAINNSPKVLISKSNIEYNKHMKEESTGLYHPVVQAGFAWQKLSNPTNFAFSPSYNYNLNLKYNLFNGFSDSSTVSSRESDLASAKLQNQAVVSDIKLAVVVAYTNYLKAKKLIKSQEEQLKSLTKQYDDTSVRYEQGIIAKNDLLLIDVEKLKSEQALIKAKSDFVVTKSNLENIMAVSIPDSESIDDFDADINEVENIEVLQERMMQNRSEIKAMQFQSKSLSYQREAIGGNYLPKVDLEASHQINDQERISGSSVFQPKDQTTYGVNVSWTLYAGLRNREMEKALLEKDNQQNYQLHQLKLDLKNQLVQAYEAFKVSKSAKYVASRAKESAEENYRITSDRYSYGNVDTLTLLVSQTTLTQAINEYNNAYYDLYVAHATLKRVTSE